MIKNDIVSEVFSDDELSIINSVIQNELSNREHVDHYDIHEGMVYDGKKVFIKKDLGRLDIPDLPLPQSIRDKVFSIGKNHYKLNKSYLKNIANITYSRYAKEYGEPRLVPHVDYGTCGLILDYQLKSNTSWAVTIEEEDYVLADNELLLLYPLDQYHWRPKKDMKDGEFIDIIFFDFHTPGLERVPDLEKEKHLRDLVYNSIKEDNQ